LLSLLKDDESPQKCDYVLSSYNGQQFGLYTQRMIRTHELKLVWNLTDIDELYDLKNDPNEMHNLIHDPKYKDMIKELNNELFTWLEKSGGNEIPVKRMGEFIRDGRNCEITCK
jgi:arylsulfatase A-like enzyme